MDFAIEGIKKDIIELNENDFVIKYILKTEVWYFTEYLRFTPEQFLGKIDLFKKIICSNLNISFNNVLIVGSGKIGCSLSPTEKLFRKFDSHKDEDKESDIDVAIISDKYFYELWDAFRKEYCTKFLWYYNKVSSSVFRGFINEDVLLEVPQVRKVWEKKVVEANKQLQYEIPIRHQINYRIYRSWEDLQEYHVNGVQKIKNILESGEMNDKQTLPST